MDRHAKDLVGIRLQVSPAELVVYCALLGVSHAIVVSTIDDLADTAAQTSMFAVGLFGASFVLHIVLVRYRLGLALQPAFGWAVCAAFSITGLCLIAAKLRVAMATTCVMTMLSAPLTLMMHLRKHRPDFYDEPVALNALVVIGGVIGGVMLLLSLSYHGA